MKRYYIRYEPMAGEWYYMIYFKSWLLGHMFFERWNTPEKAIIRLKELNHG